MLIDLRSDTVTRPTPAMREAMLRAPLGDDVLGDDPTVNELEARFAALVGKPAACFVPTGTMGNQACIRAHTEPGDEIIAHEESHIVVNEGGAPAALSGCMIRVLRTPFGQFGASDVAAAVRGNDQHYPVSKLVVLENTQNRGGGSVWDRAAVEAIAALARSRGMKMHLDGARLWNASVASGVSMADLVAPFDSVSCCFSKGLGTPVGSCAAGDAHTMARVRRFRKMFGGAMRQAGVLAAACIHALDHHVHRLADDHANAKRFAVAVAGIPGITLDRQHRERGGVETNLVFFDLGPAFAADAATLSERLRQRGVLMLPSGPRRMRAVTHLDVTREQCDAAAEAIRECA